MIVVEWYTPMWRGSGSQPGFRGEVDEAAGVVRLIDHRGVPTGETKVYNEHTRHRWYPEGVRPPDAAAVY